ncbi:MAG: phytanoyl-CoA dioxygenase family protein [Hyphomicrobiales bacterium]|nr:phytanoyl-CoA dioxygenase family protein [Hyphomicrobiales bacterium]
MNTAEALDTLGVKTDAISDEQRRQLDDDGFFVAEAFFSKKATDEMRSEFDRLREIEGDFGGHEVHIEPGAPRLSNLFNKSPAFDRCLACAPTLAAAHHLLGEIHTYSLNARNPLQGQGQQVLHSDVPRTAPDDWRVVNSMIMLDDMTEENGATRVVPGSHRWVSLNVPDVNMAEVKHIEVTPEDRKIMPEDAEAPYPGELLLTGEAGTVAVINGHTWHGGTANRSGAPRRVLHLAIGRRDIPQQSVERDFLTDSLYERTNDAMKYLLDIEGAEPKIRGYPPLPTEARVWTAAEAVDKAS